MENFTANSVAASTANNSEGQIYTVAEVAEMLGLKEQPNGKWCGAPKGTGKTKDGFILNPGGNAFTNDGDKYTSRQVAELAGISPDQYEPIVEYRARKSAAAPSRPVTPKVPQNAVKSPAKSKGKLIENIFFDYTDESGEVLYRVNRKKFSCGSKDFPTSRPDGHGEWIYNLGDIRRVLWLLPDVLNAQVVHIHEGEKAAQRHNDELKAANRYGSEVATTAPMGAGKWRADYAVALDGKHIIVWPDNDVEGRKHAEVVCASCAKVAASIKQISTEGQPKKGDVCERFDAGESLDSLTALSDATPKWMPSPPPASATQTEVAQSIVQSPDEIRAAFRSAASHVAPPVTMDELIACFRKWMFVKDDGVIKITLATFAANLGDGDPVWLMIVGGSSSGKTETVSPLASLPFARLVGTLTESSFLSGSSKRDKAKDASGGLLRELGSFGVLLMKDFTSILSIHHDKRISVLAALREIYDGSWTRDIGNDGGRKLEWRGKIGIIACCTDAIESAHAVSGAMGERFMRYRLQHDDDDQRAMTRHALRRVGHDTQMRVELEQAVAGFFGALDVPAAPDALSEEEEDRLINISMLTAKARSVVDRDAKTRDIELTHDAEIPTRLAMMLRRVLHGLQIVGVSEGESWALVQKVALDSIPKLRAGIVQLVAREHEAPSDVPLTAKAIEKTLGTSAQATRRALEELRAHAILTNEDTNIGGNKVAVWAFSELGAALWKEGFSPFPEKSPTTHTPSKTPDSRQVNPQGDLYINHPDTVPDDFPGKGHFDDAMFDGEPEAPNTYGQD